MTVNERLHTLNTLSTAKFRRLLDGYSTIANDLHVACNDRRRARRRLNLLRMAQVPSRAELAID